MSIAHTFGAASALPADEAGPERRLGPWATGLKIEPGMDASGRILRGCVLVGIDLRNAKFDNAHLGGCRIYQCDLRGASFKNAVLTGLSWGDCRVEGADLSGAVLNGATAIGEIYGFDTELTQEQLMSTRSYRTKDLSDCVVRLAAEHGELVPYQIDFRGANLRNAAFGYCDLRGSDFTDATITGATFYMCWMGAKQITETRECTSPTRMLTNVCFAGVDGPLDLSGYDLSGSTWIPKDAILADATIARCKLWGLSSESIRSTRSFQIGKLTGITFVQQDFAGFDFSAQDLTGCYFRECRFQNARFANAIISSAGFSVPRDGDICLTPEQIKSTWNYKHGRMQGIELPKNLATALQADVGN